MRTMLIEAFAVLMIALVFCGSTILAVDVFKWQDPWPLLFGAAVTLALIGVAYGVAVIREAKQLAVRRRGARVLRRSAESDLAYESPDWFNRN